MLESTYTPETALYLKLTQVGQPGSRNNLFYEYAIQNKYTQPLQDTLLQVHRVNDALDRSLPIDELNRLAVAAYYV